MMPETIPGTEGYAEQAVEFHRHSEIVSFKDVHGSIARMLPTTPGHVLDIGAGTGRDAVAFAELGHRVVAVEPVDELREIGIRQHSSQRIEWIGDSLPRLHSLNGLSDAFDVVMLTAVWMHLDQPARVISMPHVAGLVRPGGVVSISLRHGPVPAGRVMYDVSAEETIRLGEASGLRLLLDLRDQSSAYKRTDVTWTRLVWGKSGIDGNR